MKELTDEIIVAITFAIIKFETVRRKLLKVTGLYHRKNNPNIRLNQIQKESKWQTRKRGETT